MDGKTLAAKVRTEATALVQQAQASGTQPGLAVILVGDDPASATYVRLKARDCRECGITPFDHHLPATTTQEELNALIADANADPAVHGILVQLPLPAGLDAEQAISCIAPEKDVDGFSPVSLGRLMRGLPGMRPCTPWGIMRMLDEYDIPIAGANAVIVGRSNIVGKPMAQMLLARDATVTVCHSHTRDLPAICRTADILVVATGKPQFVDASYIKPGAVVIDVGMDRTDAGLVGDVDYDEVAPLSKAITPVPGGVGPMTRAMLMLNVAQAALAQGL
jgi:methylenetetrahydrofolate dehydrogenase (NADP+)/methenyltetrahydrofolate cyclohydrolase